MRPRTPFLFLYQNNGMKKIIVLVLLVTAQQAYSQCEPVSLFNLDLFITQGGGGLKYVKFAFTKIAEDSAEVTFANCKWDSTGKCYAYKEYAIASKKMSVTGAMPVLKERNTKN